MILTLLLILIGLAICGRSLKSIQHGHEVHQNSIDRTLALPGKTFNKIDQHTPSSGRWLIFIALCLLGLIFPLFLLIALVYLGLTKVRR